MTPFLIDTGAAGFLRLNYGSPFSPEQEAQLAQIAAHAGTDTEGLVKDAALRMVDETAGFRAAVREGIAQADRGDLLEDDVVRSWLEEQERS